jgi:eukaryotic-like serine/threonine-protein kinase
VGMGRYEVFYQLGSGGMAQVYLGVQRGPFATQKLVVIKRLRREVAEDRDFLAMFVDEGRLAVRLNHPNVVHTYEIVVDDPEHYLVMEFLDGRSLLQVLRRIGRAQVPIEEHIWILTQVLAGLQYAHELRDFDGSLLGVVHRDVSPANVVVCHSGEVKLVDFGIAKAAGALAETQQGVLKGKLGYAAPEQCLGHAADPRSDIYAVGVMLWEAIAQQRRTSGETLPAILQARIRNSEPPIELVSPSAPGALVAITRRALQRNPDARYTTALEFRRDLEEYLGGSSRRVGAESVAALLRPHFQKERDQVRHAIEEYFRNSGNSGTLPAAGRLGPVQSGRSGLIVTNIAGLELDATSPTPTDDVSRSRANLLLAETRGMPFAAKKRRLGLAAMIAVLLSVALAAAILVLLRMQRTEEAGLSATLRASAPRSNGEQAPQAGSSPAAGAASEPGAEVRLRASATPAHAKLHLDGRLLSGNPFVGMVKRDDREHELSVSADAYQTKTRMLRFDRDLDVELSLSRAARFERMVRAARPQPAAAAPAPEAPPPAAPAAEPGVDLRSRSGGRVKRSIDEKDPYGQ